jgi:integrase
MFVEWYHKPVRCLPSHGDDHAAWVFKCADVEYTFQGKLVEIEARRARIHKGKGGKSRVVALGAVLVDHLLPDTGGNVVTGTSMMYSAATLQRRVNRAMHRAGVDGTFHALRHRYGTLAYQATRDLVAVGRQMGHSSPVTTAIYAAASDDIADEIAEAVAR